MQKLLDVANVVAENSSATNGQVADILVATCAAIIEHFPRNDNMLASFSVHMGNVMSAELRDVLRMARVQAHDAKEQESK